MRSRNNLIQIIITVILSFFFMQCAQENVPGLYKAYRSDDYLYWSQSRKLTWKDFEGYPVNPEEKTISDIHVYNPSMIVKDNLFSKPRIVSICVFDKKHSWVNTNIATKSALLYDQLIFDVYELYARKLREEFSKTDFSGDDYKAVFQKLAEQNNEALIQTIKEIRKDTSLGQIKEATNLWQYKIDEGLQSLENYGVDYNK